MEVDIEYEFKISESLSFDYKCCSSIINWLKDNLESITDDNGKLLFNKVNFGYNEESIKGFGKKPVCDVYINNLNYDSDFDGIRPDSVTSFVICYLKGNMNTAYEKSCELADYLIQEFNENESFRRLTDVVMETYVRDVQFTIIPTGKTYGILCAFELEHILYK